MNINLIKAESNIPLCRVSKECYAHHSPQKFTLSANFTGQHRGFNIHSIPKAKKMRGDILQLSKNMDYNQQPFLDKFDSTQVNPSDNPIYEDPRDVIVDKCKVYKRSMSPRKQCDSRAIIKDHKKKLNKKYESLITALMERCEDNVLMINEKEAHLLKQKEKLKIVLEYNKLFAKENDQLKSQHATMISYIDDYKHILEDLNTKTKELELRNNDLNEKIKQYELPNKEHSDLPATIPLVEVCMSCSSREIVLRQTRDHNTRLQLDMQALKDVLYRLNVQLSRYQERLRSNIQNMAKTAQDGGSLHKPEVYDSAILDSLLANSLGLKAQEGGNTEECRSSRSEHDTARTVNLSGLLSAQALGPLFDAYQESIQEKENLISDYEKQFENMNRKTKQIIIENKELKDKVLSLEDNHSSLRHSLKRICVEKETLDIDRATLLERCEKAETKLKEVYELYEDKMAAIMRDYETVHREYFATKSALALAESKILNLDAALRAPGMRTVPADLHERRVDNCKRLLEDLKHQYSIDTDKKNNIISKLQQDKKSTEEKYLEIIQEQNKIKEELKAALKNVGLYRKAAMIFRQRMKASVATVNTIRKSHRRRRAATRQCALPSEPTMLKLDKIKQEIKAVKIRASSSLEELERRLRAQERRAGLVEQEHGRELERAHLVLEHKERIIRSLIDKVADVEEVRLSQSSAHRLQGINLEHIPSDGPGDKRVPAKLLQTSAGYYQDLGREVLTKK